MLPNPSNYDHNLDALVKQALQAHQEPPHPEFTQKVVRQIETQMFLAEIRRHERLTTLGWVVAAVILIVLTAVFRDAITFGADRSVEALNAVLAMASSHTAAAWLFPVALAVLAVGLIFSDVWGRDSL